MIHPDDPDLYGDLEDTDGTLDPTNTAPSTLSGSKEPMDENPEDEANSKRTKGATGTITPTE